MALCSLRAHRASLRQRRLRQEGAAQLRPRNRRARRRHPQPRGGAVFSHVQRRQPPRLLHHVAFHLIPKLHLEYIYQIYIYNTMFDYNMVL